MKPKWFYDHIGMVAKTNPELAIKLFDAELYDEVKAIVRMRRELIDVHDWMGGIVEVIPGRMDIFITLIDAPPPVHGVPLRAKRFPDKVFGYVDSTSLTWWAIDVSKDARYNGLFCFRDMLDDKWYFVNPVFLDISDGRKSRW